MSQKVLLVQRALQVYERIRPSCLRSRSEESIISMMSNYELYLPGERLNGVVKADFNYLVGKNLFREISTDEGFKYISSKV